MMFWKKYKEAVIVLIFLLAMGVVYYFVISRLIAEIAKNSNKLQELGAIHENQQKRLGDLPKFKKDFEKLEDKEKKIFSFLEKDRAVELIQEIEKLAEDTGNEVVIEVAPPDVPVKGGAKNASETIVGSLPIKEYIQLKIKITGTFFSLLKLINKIENSKYYLDIVSLQISRNQKTEKDKSTESISKNPFSQNSPEISLPKEEEQTISQISVVVYTKN